MNKPGPKPALDEVKKAEICTWLTQGGSRRAAARYVGCSHNTIGNTAKRDDGFAEQLRKAEMQCELNALTHINAAGGKSWRASAWILERTRPEQYEKITLRQPTFAQISDFWDECAGMVLESLPDEFRRPVERRLEKASRRFAKMTNIGGAKSPGQGKNGQGKQEGMSAPLGARVARTQAPIKSQAAIKSQAPGDSRPADDSGEFAFDPHAALRAMESVDKNQDRRLEAFPQRLIAKHEQRRQELEIENIREWRDEYYSLPASDDDGDEPDWIEQLREAEIPAGHPAYEEFSRPPVGEPSEVGEAGEQNDEQPGNRGAGLMGAAVLLLAVALTAGAWLAGAGMVRGDAAPFRRVACDALLGDPTVEPERVASERGEQALRQNGNFDQQPQTPTQCWSKSPGQQAASDQCMRRAGNQEEKWWRAVGHGFVGCPRIAQISQMGWDTGLIAGWAARRVMSST